MTIRFSKEDFLQLGVILGGNWADYGPLSCDFEKHQRRWLALTEFHFLFFGNLLKRLFLKRLFLKRLFLTRPLFLNASTSSVRSINKSKGIFISKGEMLA